MNSPETLQVTMTITPDFLNRMVTEQDIKDEIKFQLAYGLAKKFIEKKQIDFSYRRDISDSQVIVTGKMRV